MYSYMFFETQCMLEQCITWCRCYWCRITGSSVIFWWSSNKPCSCRSHCSDNTQQNALNSSHVNHLNVDDHWHC